MNRSSICFKTNGNFRHFVSIQTNCEKSPNILKCVDVAHPMCQLCRNLSVAKLVDAFIVLYSDSLCRWLPTETTEWLKFGNSKSNFRTRIPNFKIAYDSQLPNRFRQCDQKKRENHWYKKCYFIAENHIKIISRSSIISKLKKILKP